MLARLFVVVSMLISGLASASSQRVYVVRWPSEQDTDAERRELIHQADRRLRDELRRCGAAVLEGEPASTEWIVLRPRLEVLPGGLWLRVVGVRGGDQKLLGTISTRASGASRAAQLRAVVSRVCDEAGRLE